MTRFPFLPPGWQVVLVIAVLARLLHRPARHYYNRATGRRGNEMAALAYSHGWHYVDSDHRWADGFSGAPFGSGRDRRSTNILTGSRNGHPFVAFDYQYSGAQTRSGSARRYSVCGVDLGVAAPLLQVSPEGMFDRVADHLTDHDIELESEQFNRAFLVTCPDRKFATDVLSPQMMEYLLTLPHLAWGFRDGFLLTVANGRQSAAALDGTLAAIDGIVQRIPPFVWSGLGRTGPPTPA